MKRVILGLIALAGTAAGWGQAPGWTRLETPHLTLYSAGPVDQAREWTVKAEACRQLIAGLGPADDRALDRLTIAIFRDESHFERYFAPPADRSVSNDWTIRYLVGARTLMSDGQVFCAVNPEHGELAEPALFLLVGAWASRPFPRPLPEWISKGLQDICAQGVLHGDRVEFGGRHKADLDVLRGKLPLPLEELMKPANFDDVASAEAWLLMHYLLWGNDGANRAILNRYLDAWTAGRSEQEAAFAAFPGGFDDLTARLAVYQKKGKFKGETVVVPPAVLRATKERAATELEREILLAQMLIVGETPERAGDHLDRAWRLAPHSPEMLEAKALQAGFQHQRGQADDYYGQAVAAGSTLHFALATKVLEEVRPVAGTESSVEFTDGTQARKAATAIRGLLERNPYYYPAYEWYALVIGALPEVTTADEQVMERGKKLYPAQAGIDLGWMAFHLKHGDFDRARAVFTKLQADKTPVPPNLEGYATRLWVHLETASAYARLQQQYSDGEFDQAAQTIRSILPAALAPAQRAAAEDIRTFLEAVLRAREAMNQKLYGSATGFVEQALRDKPPAKAKARLEAMQAEIAAAKAQAAP